MDEYDHCYECKGHGDNYYFDYDGELVIACSSCPYNPNIGDWNDDDD